MNTECLGSERHARWCGVRPFRWAQNAWADRFGKLDRSFVRDCILHILHCRRTGRKLIKIINCDLFLCIQSWFYYKQRGLFFLCIIIEIQWRIFWKCCYIWQGNKRMGNILREGGICQEKSNRISIWRQIGDCWMIRTDWLSFRENTTYSFNGTDLKIIILAKNGAG